jgi:hypothetical protein
MKEKTTEREAARTAAPGRKAPARHSFLVLILVLPEV